MRIALVALVAVVSSSALVGCSAPVPTQTTHRAGSSSGNPSRSKTGGDDTTLQDDGSDDATETDAGTPPPALPDGDGDGIPDETDCDPSSALLAGTKLLEDDLTTDKGLFAAGDGFPQGSWMHDGTAYRQTRIGDAADASLFVKDGAIGDAIVEVVSASTEVAAITPRLRQIFVLLGTSITGGQLSAIGCGIEVVQGEATEQKTSVVRLTGAPGAVSTTALQRVDRKAVQVDEAFSLKARLAQGTLTCDVTNGGVTTTATASGLGSPKGSVGLFTRQTKALFKTAKICKLK